MSKIIFDDGRQIEVEDLTPAQVHMAIIDDRMSISDLREWRAAAFDDGFAAGCAETLDD